MRMKMVLKLLQTRVKYSKSLQILMITKLTSKLLKAWLAEHGFVHVGQNDYAKYDPLITGDTSQSKYE